jgi:NTE family protein
MEMQHQDWKPGLGLGLSGGGFRASFFHLGVLARMAEMGILRHVEVISTVSGGSIVGAAYYLAVKTLLESKTNAEITDDDYRDVVKKMEYHFRSAVQQNLRMRTFANPIKNIRMMMPNYSRSDSIGELYDSLIYRELIGAENSNEPIKMSDLIITPEGRKDFHPANQSIDKKPLKAKVPILLLNATSLNSGHNWVFTARSMGEIPPRNKNFSDVDKKDRYRRVNYAEIDKDVKARNFPLGSAVAASAAVPGLFPPMAVSDLYQDHRVQLVDGGVYDNQGIAGLLDPDHPCSDFVISDASGQSEADDNPDSGVPAVLSATTSVLTSRVREEMVNDLISTRDDKTRHVAYFHLTRGLLANQLSARGQQPADQINERMRSGITPSADDYGVPATMQAAISKIRTDLDSFSDVEVDALEADAYLMSEKPLQELPEKYHCEMKEHEWTFKHMIDRLKKDDGIVLIHLEIARHLFFKPLLLTKKFGGLFGLALWSLPLLAVLVFYLWLIWTGISLWLAPYTLWDVITLDQAALTEFSVTVLPPLLISLVFYAIAAVADMVIKGSSKLLKRIRFFVQLPHKLITGVFRYLVFPVLMFVPFFLYVKTVDRYFVNKLGKL